MAFTRISFNINNQAVGNSRSLVDHYLNTANPTVVLYMEGMAETLQAYELLSQKQDDPIVIYRDYATVGHDTAHKNYSPEEMLQKVRNIYGNNKHIWVYLLNEPHATGYGEVNDLNVWLATTINLLCSDGYRVVAGNFSAGTIDNPQWMEDFLNQASYWGKRGQLLLSEHTYGSPIIPLMFNRIAGPQNLIGGEYISHEQMITRPEVWQPQYWPLPEQIMEAFYGFGGANEFGGAEKWQTSLWHGLRISRFYIYAEEVMEIELPSFIATEGAWDRMPDLAGMDRRFEYNGYFGHFYEHLTRMYGTSGYGEIKGHSSYENCYRQVYPNLSFDEALFLQLEWLNEALPPECIGITLFTASWDNLWSEQYSTNFFKNPLVWQMLERQANGEQLYENILYDKFGIESKDEIEMFTAKITSTSNTNIRREAGITFPVVGVLQPEDIVQLSYEVVPDITGANYNWRRVLKSDGTTGFSAEGYFTYQEIVPENPPTNSDIENRVVLLEQWKEEVMQALDEIRTSLNELFD